MMDFVIENNILKGATRPIDVDRKIGQLIYHVLGESFDHVAQIDAETGVQTTCGEMKERSVRCALWMKKMGISPDAVVVVVTHNHLDSYIPVFATFFVDAIFSAWNHNITLYSARRFMKKFHSKFIFTCEEAADVLIEAAELENLNVQFAVFGKHSKVQSLNEILDSQTREEVDNFTIVNVKGSQDVAAVMLSSGSTGFPKGVVLSSSSLVALTTSKNNETCVPLKFLWYSTLQGISCLCFILQTLLKKNVRIITGHVEVQSFFQIIQKYKVNLAFVLQNLVIHVAKSNLAQNYDLRSLKVFMMTGSKHSRQTLENLRRKLPATSVCQGYSTACTEMGPIAVPTSESKHIESSGFVLANCQVKFVDLVSGKALGPNRKGEVYAKTPNPMIGYYNDPEATRQAFDEEGWYRTGDIGYYNEAGEIFIVDRIKEIIKCKSYPVSPAEIEELLLSHPEVQEVAVVGIPHELDGDWPTAFVRKAPGSRVTEDDLMNLTSVLEDYKKLQGGVHFVDTLPQTGTGKIAKHELKNSAMNLLKCNIKF